MYFSGSLFSPPRVDNETNALEALNAVLVFGVAAAEKRGEVEAG